MDWLYQVEYHAWLVLEYIPASLPCERWLADPQVIGTLHQLHTSDLPALATPRFQPTWTDELTHQALQQFAPNVQHELAPLLQRVQHNSQSLFGSRCWISGDPNMTNWGLRTDGTVVLYDWERFGRGTPALDLAITIPGMGNQSAFERVAAAYRAVSNKTLFADIRALASPHAIAQVKVWSIIEFLSMVTRGAVAHTEGVVGLVKAFPTWLKAMQHAESS